MREHHEGPAAGRGGVEQVRDGLAALSERPVAQHVDVLSGALDAIVAELDDLARTIPPAR